MAKSSGSSSSSGSRTSGKSGYWGGSAPKGGFTSSPSTGSSGSSSSSSTTSSKAGGGSSQTASTPTSQASMQQSTRAGSTYTSGGVTYTVQTKESVATQRGSPSVTSSGSKAEYYLNPQTKAYSTQPIAGQTPITREQAMKQQNAPTTSKPITAGERQYINEYAMGQEPDKGVKVEQSAWDKEVARRRAYEQSKKDKAIGIAGKKGKYDKNGNLISGTEVTTEKTGTVTIASPGFESLVGQKLTQAEAKSLTTQEGTNEEILARRSVGQDTGFQQSVMKVEQPMKDEVSSMLPQQTQTIQGGILVPGMNTISAFGESLKQPEQKKSLLPLKTNINSLGLPMQGVNAIEATTIGLTSDFEKVTPSMPKTFEKTGLVSEVNYETGETGREGTITAQLTPKDLVGVSALVTLNKNVIEDPLSVPGKRLELKEKVIESYRPENIEEKEMGYLFREGFRQGSGGIVGEVKARASKEYAEKNTMVEGVPWYAQPVNTLKSYVYGTANVVYNVPNILEQTTGIDLKKSAISTALPTPLSFIYTSKYGLGQEGMSEKEKMYLSGRNVRAIADYYLFSKLGQATSIASTTTKTLGNTLLPGTPKFLKTVGSVGTWVGFNIVGYGAVSNKYLDITSTASKQNNRDVTLVYNLLRAEGGGNIYGGEAITKEIGKKALKDETSYTNAVIKLGAAKYSKTRDVAGFVEGFSGMYATIDSQGGAIKTSLFGIPGTQFTLGGGSLYGELPSYSKEKGFETGKLLPSIATGIGGKYTARWFARLEYAGIASKSPVKKGLISTLGYGLDVQEGPGDIYTPYGFSNKAFVFTPSFSATTSQTEIKSKGTDYSYNINFNFAEDKTKSQVKEITTEQTRQKPVKVYNSVNVLNFNQAKTNSKSNMFSEVSIKSEPKPISDIKADIPIKNNIKTTNEAISFSEATSTSDVPAFNNVFTPDVFIPFPLGGGDGTIAGGFGGEGRAKRKYSYAASFEAKVRGIYGKAPKLAAGGVFSGQELRPILGKAPKKSKSKMFNPMAEFLGKSKSKAKKSKMTSYKMPKFNFKKGFKL